jgi:carbonic anhydrase
MDRRRVLKALAGLALCPHCTSAGFAADAHWTYEGHGGPDQWSELDAANRVCSAGAQQSPVDIGDTFKAKLSPLKMTWGKSADTIVNNGHTIQVNFTDASTLAAPGGNFKLIQLHFHHPSEHLIGGKSFPMEAHFVHASPTGGLAVVGVLMATGKPNAVFNKIVSTMPEQEGPPVKSRSGHRSQRAAAGEAQLLPSFRIADHAAVQRDGRLAPAHRSDRGGGGRCRPLRQALPAECAPGAEEQPALRIAVELSRAAGWAARRRPHRHGPRRAGIVRASHLRNAKVEISGCATRGRGPGRATIASRGPSGRLLAGRAAVRYNVIRRPQKLKGETT